MHLHTRVCTHVVYAYARDCVSIVGVASVAADVAAVPRYRRAVAWTPSIGPHDMIYQPCLLLCAVLFPTSIALSLPLRLVPRLLDSRSAMRPMRASHLRPAALRTLRSVQGRPSAYGACDARPYTVPRRAEPSRPIRREGEWISREKINEESR